LLPSPMLMGVVAKLRYVAYRKASGYHGRAPGFVYVHSGTARRESMRIHHPYGDASEDANGAAKRQMSWFFERKDTTRGKIRFGECNHISRLISLAHL